MFLKISLSRFTNFVFPLLKWLSVLVTTKVLVRMHGIHRSHCQVRSPCEIDCVTHDEVVVLLEKQTDWSIDKLSCKNLF